MARSSPMNAAPVEDFEADPKIDLVASFANVALVCQWPSRLIQAVSSIFGRGFFKISRVS